MGAAVGLRSEVDAAVIAAIDGGGELDRAAIVRRFLDRASRSTLFRWIDEVIRERQRAAAPERRPGRRTAPRTESPPGAGPRLDATRAAPPATAELVAQPTLVGLTTGTAGIPVIEQLQACSAAIQQVMQYARTPDGKVRNAKLMLAAVEHMRRALETSSRLQEQLMELSQVEQFHEAVFAVLRRKDPRMVEEVLAEMRALNASWSRAA